MEPRVIAGGGRGCETRADDEFLEKVGGMNMEQQYVYSVWHFDRFFSLLFKSGYVHSLVYWVLICAPGAALVYVVARCIRELNLINEDEKEHYKSLQFEVDCMKMDLHELRAAVLEKIKVEPRGCGRGIPRRRRKKKNKKRRGAA